MKAKLLIILFLIPMLLIGCGNSSQGRYFIQTDATYRVNFKTNDYIIDGDILILHGYWSSMGRTYYENDYVLNTSDVLGIWEGYNQLYPVVAQEKSFWDFILGGTLPLHFSIPLWIPSLILLLAILYLLRWFIYEIFKEFIKPQVIVSKLISNSPLISKQSNILHEIKIPLGTQGIIAVREWNVKKHILISANQGLVWESTDISADELPANNNVKGIYAYRLGTNLQRSWAKVAGLVSMYGHCVGHNDGLIRAQRCRILMLFCPWPFMAKNLSAKYNVPVMLTLDKRRTLERWLVSHDGIHWLQHNAEIIDGETLVEQEIEEILAKEEFQNDDKRES